MNPVFKRNVRVASSETAREINRDLLLEQIHRHQPVSRADLARLTGLQPSTVSIIIGNLIDEGWVLPGVVGRLPRGRRPTYVVLNEQHACIAIDLRPDYANIAVVDINGKIFRRKTIPFSAPKGSVAAARRAISAIARAARALRKAEGGRVFHGIGVSVSGRVNQETNRMLFSPNTPWAEINLEGELTSVLRGPVTMENAANACLFAERWFGEYSKVANMIAISVAEGVGTGLIVDGRLLRGRDHMAGEFGHMPFDDSGPECGCGNKGCWETFASNRAALRYYRELVPESQLKSFHGLMERASAGDIHALRAVDKMSAAVGRGMALLSAGLAPEVILIVGECTALWPRIRPTLESQLISRSFSARTPRVVPAMEGDWARLRGAAAIALYKALFPLADSK